MKFWFTQLAVNLPNFLEVCFLRPELHPMRIPTPGFLLSAFFQVCKRFPGTMLCAILGTIACFVLIERNDPSDAEQFFVRSWMVSQLGIPFMTAIIAYSESKAWDEKRQWLLQLLGFAALIGCWFWLDSRSEAFDWKILPQYFALMIVMHLAVAVAPYLNARSVRDFWEYNRQLFANLVIGAAFTLILFVGLALAILAVDNLFNTNIPEQTYAKLYVLLAGIFNTAYFLFHFPRKYSPEERNNPAVAEDGVAYNLVFRNLCKYILIPIVILYFLILYAYGAKIGLQWSLPQGWVSSLVIGFSVAGIFTYLLNFYLAEEDNSLIVKGFKKWFWWVLLPLTALLFVAIGKRIGDYGFTEERYLVLVLGVWLVSACVYFLFSKSDNIKFIPISLALLALLWAFGPLSAFAVSGRSQKGILTQILKNNGRFENGKMKPGASTLTEPEREQASSAINYLEKRKALTEFLPEPVDSALFEYGGLLSWLKIDNATASSAYTFSISPLNSSEPLDIRGYDMAYKADLNPGNREGDDEPGPYFCLSEDGKMLEWREKKDGKSTLVEMFSLSPTIQKWQDKNNTDEAYNSLRLPISERSVSFSGRRGLLRFIAQDAEITVDGQEKRLNYCNGWILLKEN